MASSTQQQTFAARARLANERYRSIDRARRLDEWRRTDGQCPEHKKADLVNVQRWLGVKVLDRKRKNVYVRMSR